MITETILKNIQNELNKINKICLWFAGYEILNKTFGANNVELLETLTLPNNIMILDFQINNNENDLISLEINRKEKTIICY